VPNIFIVCNPEQTIGTNYRESQTPRLSNFKTLRPAPQTCIYCYRFWGKHFDFNGL